MAHFPVLCEDGMNRINVASGALKEDASAWCGFSHFQCHARRDASWETFRSVLLARREEVNPEVLAREELPSCV